MIPALWSRIRKHRRVLVLVFLLLLAAASGVSMAQVPAEVPAGAPPPTVPVPAAQPGGLYLSPFWLGFVMVTSALWLYLTSWVCDDARGVGMNAPTYAGAMIAAGGLSTALALLVHAAFGFLTLVLVTGTLTGYIILRNRVAPERFKLFGPFHRAQILARVPLVNKLAAARIRRAALKPSLTLTNAEGQSLNDILTARPALSEGARLLSDTVLRAGATKTRKVRLQPAGEQYIAQYILDGVLHNVEPCASDVALQALGAVAQLVGLSKEGRLRPGSGEFETDVPIVGHVKVGAQVTSSDGKPSLVLSLPDWTADLYRGGLGGLGVHDAVIKRLRSAVQQQKGTVLVCGPAGSGTTTTLYGIIGLVDIFTTDIAMIEKKAEHELEHVRRWALSEEHSFSAVYDEVEREGPQVIVLGGMETREQAGALLTFGSKDGLLLTVAKAPDGPESLLHLASLAQDPALVGNSVTCVVSQRLVRKLCTSCREQVEPDPVLLKRLQVDPADPGVWFKPVGCGVCLNCGYQGRTGIFGMLILTDPVKDAIRKAGATPASIRQAAGHAAFRTMYQDGVSKVIAGITTPDEVSRVLKAQ